MLARRPKKARVAYKTEDGQDVEEELSDFPARVFLHEVEHLAGLNFLNWEISLCDIEVSDPKLYFFKEVIFCVLTTPVRAWITTGNGCLTT